MKKILCSIVLFACTAIAEPLFGQDAAMIYQLDSIAVIDQKVMMPMRDGIRLATDIYRPKGEGKYPIVFLELLIILIHG